MNLKQNPSPPNPPRVPPPRLSLRPGEPPVLVFSPLAWLKLQFFLHSGDTEIGGFGVCDPENLLHIQDFVTVRQQVSSVTVEFDDVAVADYFDAMVDKGLAPQHFGRIWCHTHPGSSAQPSGTDEECFERVFGRCDWSIMFILARGGQTYARLQFNTGPGGSVLLPVQVNWAGWPRMAVEQAEDLGHSIEGWTREYLQNIHPVVDPLPRFYGRTKQEMDELGLLLTAEDLENECWAEEWMSLEALEAMNAAHEQRQEEEVE